MFKRYVFLTIASLAIEAAPASATVFTHNVTFDAASILDLGTFNNPTGSQRIQLVPSGAMSSTGVFTITAGDTIETNITISNGGLTLQNGAAGTNEVLRFGWNVPGFNVNAQNPGLMPVVTYNRTNELIINSFGGSLNVTPDVVDTFSQPAPTFNQFYIGNITDSIVTLTNFTIRTTFHSIVFDAPFDQDFSLPIEITSNSLLAIDQVYPAPAPGAIALLGFGLLGIGMRRRVTA